MAELRITLDKNNIPAALDILRNLADHLREYRPPMERLLQRLQRYPPPPAGSSYERTYALQSSWMITEVMTHDVIGAVTDGALTDYNRLVMGQEEQATVHSGRWDTTHEIAEEEEAAVAVDYLEYIQILLKGA